jgi:hypothetical protein
MTGAAAPPRGFDSLVYDAGGVDLETVLTRVRDATPAQWDWLTSQLEHRYTGEQLAEMRGYFFGDEPQGGSAPST